MSQKDKNKQIAAIFLRNNKFKQSFEALWPGVLEAVNAIESCPVELVLGAAQAMNSIGPSYGLQVTIFCVPS
jgi:hypothetical protein